MQRNDFTVERWFLYWLETYFKPKAKPSAYNSYWDIINGHIIPTLGNLPLEKLDVPTAQTFLNELLRSGNRKTGGPLSAKSVKNVRVLMTVSLQKAVMEHRIAANPMPDTEIPPVRWKEATPMTDDTQRKLEEFLFKDSNYQNMGILIALYTGCRLGEVCALQWRDYDMTYQMLNLTRTVKRMHNENKGPKEPKTKLTFSCTKGKNGQRTVPVSPALAQILAYQRERGIREFGILQPGDFIVYNTRGQMTDPDNLTHYFAEVLQKLGLPHARYHDIRHTFATCALENGVDVLTVSGLLGHAKVTTTEQFYLHPRMDSMRRAMNALQPITTLKFGT